MKTYWLLLLVDFLVNLSEVVMITPSDDEIFRTSNIDESTVSSTTSEVKVDNTSLHNFFRSMTIDAKPSEVRRVFGGSAVDLDNFKPVCALLDRYWAVRCTATALTQYWVLTAAHCVTSNLAYVKYNTRRPASSDGNITAVRFLYQHPKFKVVQMDDGRGKDVVGLHHDVGLVRTRDKMKIAGNSIMAGLRTNNALDLYNNIVQVLGFGRTERSVLGEELFGVELKLVKCERSDWVYCVCGVANATLPRGVCSGDSGGPVLYQGEMIGVTSMGPVECAQNSETLPIGATSVFTSLYPYADVINATILDTETTLRMRILSHASDTSPSPLFTFAALLIIPMQ